jgi:hypothetical protein
MASISVGDTIALYDPSYPKVLSGVVSFVKAISGHRHSVILKYVATNGMAYKDFELNSSTRVDSLAKLGTTRYLKWMSPLPAADVIALKEAIKEAEEEEEEEAAETNAVRGANPTVKKQKMASPAHETGTDTEAVTETEKLLYDLSRTNQMLHAKLDALDIRFATLADDLSRAQRQSSRSARMHHALTDNIRRLQADLPNMMIEAINRVQAE